MRRGCVVREGPRRRDRSGSGRAGPWGRCSAPEARGRRRAPKRACFRRPTGVLKDGEGRGPCYRARGRARAGEGTLALPMVWAEVWTQGAGGPARAGNNARGPRILTDARARPAPARASPRSGRGRREGNQRTRDPRPAPPPGPTVHPATAPPRVSGPERRLTREPRAANRPRAGRLIHHLPSPAAGAGDLATM